MKKELDFRYNFELWSEKKYSKEYLDFGYNYEPSSALRQKSAERVCIPRPAFPFFFVVNIAAGAYPRRPFRFLPLFPSDVGTLAKKRGHVLSILTFLLIGFDCADKRGLFGVLGVSYYPLGLCQSALCFRHTSRTPHAWRVKSEKFFHHSLHTFFHFILDFGHNYDFRASQNNQNNFLTYDITMHGASTKKKTRADYGAGLGFSSGTRNEERRRKAAFRLWSTKPHSFPARSARFVFCPIGIRQGFPLQKLWGVGQRS